MAARLKAVLVGCGGISDAWLTPLQKIPDVELVGLVDIRLEAAQAKKSKFNLERAETGENLRTMLKVTRPDIVFDCTVPEAHVGVTLEALRRGCHVFGEKPMADSLANARKMVAAAQKAKRLFAVMQNRRYDPRIRSFCQLLASGRIGPLTTLTVDFMIGAHFGGFRDHLRHVLLLDMAIHTFDAARLISGADAVAVYCHEWNPAGSWYDHDAAAVAIFEMTGGVVCAYRGCWCAEGLNTAWESEWRALGPRGSVAWDGRDAFRCQAVKQTGGFFSEMEDVAVPVAADGKQGSHAGCIAEFIECARTGAIPETICTDNIKSLAMVFGAIESAEKRRRVKIAVAAEDSKSGT
jgi:predicted dehydrogenase